MLDIVPCCTGRLKIVKINIKINFFNNNIIFELKLLLTKFHLFWTKTSGVIEVRKNGRKT
jgi:hypothetical protein